MHYSTFLLLFLTKILDEPNVIISAEVSLLISALKNDNESLSSSFSLVAHYHITRDGSIENLFTISLTSYNIRLGLVFYNYLVNNYLFLCYDMGWNSSLFM